MVRAFIVEDDADFANSLVSAVSQLPEIEVTGVFPTAMSLVKAIPVDDSAAREWLPDFLFVDVYAFERLENRRSGGAIDGVTLAAYLCQVRPDMRVLVISSINPSALLESFKEKGLSRWAYLLKSTSLSVTDIQRAVRELLYRP